MTFFLLRTSPFGTSFCVVSLFGEQNMPASKQNLIYLQSALILLMKLWICSAEKAQMRVSSASLRRVTMVHIKSTKIFWDTNSSYFLAGFVELYVRKALQIRTAFHPERTALVFWGDFLVFIYHVATLQGFPWAIRIKLCHLSMCFKLSWGHSFVFDNHQLLEAYKIFSDR